ncbi:RNA polymerase sigma factor [Cellulomonas sp. SLBN-39]|uniref:RNA polymerase sigma factor n=1 Tax=Cellulomonas sp. SLBN-39 TaxID=2768446 RepID=UPI00116D874E|nr:sigma-70 family RNA polymerase sigma factor [Cellulomonas sp. SLBN-39]TQL02237.1 RNA polymerase sigma factor (sigma-70 family) [Cellulomonas sp. SLBN-39]
MPATTRPSTPASDRATRSRPHPNLVATHVVLHPDTRDDQEDRVPDGWEPMLEALVRERWPALLARARMLARDPRDAEDLVQEALVATFRGRARFASLPEAEQYVRRAVVSRFYDQARRAQREGAASRRLAARPVPDVPGPDVRAAGLADEVEAALAELAPRERACVVLRHLDDVSVRDTAHLLGLSEGAVKRYTSDGVRALAVRLGVPAPSEPAGAPVRLVPTVKEARRG